jgi:hypothetical protein
LEKSDQLRAERFQKHVHVKLASQAGGLGYHLSYRLLLLAIQRENPSATIDRIDLIFDAEHGFN